MSLETVKKIFIIAGPNGAGKTTFAREFLPDEAACLQFVNADLIAAGLSTLRLSVWRSALNKADTIFQKT